MAITAEILSLFDEKITLVSQSGYEISARMGVGPRDNRPHYGAKILVLENQVCFGGVKSHSEAVLSHCTGLSPEFSRDGAGWFYDWREIVVRGFICEASFHYPGRHFTIKLSNK